MHDINLIPCEYTKKKEKPRIIALSAMLVLLYFVALIFLYLSPLYKLRLLQKENQMYEAAVIEDNLISNEISENKKLLDNTEKRLNVLNEISSNEIKPTVVLDTIKGAIPRDVLLRSLSYTTTGVSLNAVSDTAVGVSEFYIELSKISVFEDVSLSPVAKDEDGYNFSINITIKTGSDENAEEKNK